MSFFVVIAIGVVQTITAIVGSYVASKKFTYKQKRPFFWVFVGLAAIGLSLTIWQAVLMKRTGEDATRTAMGDADHPPWSGNGAPRSAISPRNPTMRIGSRSRFWPSPASMAASDIDESRRCSSRPA